MRLAFVKKLTELARKDKNVWLITGDLGFSVFEDFAKEFPDQYLNVGVSEQNLVGVAAGLAMMGKRPFVYSITTFASMRPYEQIRNDICYQNLPVAIIGGGSSFSYSTFGCTHVPMEDMAIMRVLPNMAVLSPGDPVEVGVLLEQAYKRKGPSYMRIAKRGEPVVHANSEQISLGKLSGMKAGTDVAIIVTGRQLPNAMTAADKLVKEGISTAVYSAHTIKPFDENTLLQIAKNTSKIVVCEEHSVIGGLYGVICEILVKNQISIPVHALGITDEFPKGVGSTQEYFLNKYGLSVEGIIEASKRK